MKKVKQFILKNQKVSLGIFLAGILTTSLVSAAYSKISPTANLDSTEMEKSYGALGYGRGNNSKQNDVDNYRQGTGRNSNGKNKGSQRENLNKENCLMDGCLLVDDADYPVGELDQITIEYLEAAIADERKALATYEATMDKFGNVRPFINIARAEEQHISMLKGLFDKYGVEVPADTTTVGALPNTLSEVCAVGVQAEIDNDQLYQDMIGNIQEQDIKDIFTALASASLQMHLPAFEKCAN
jgi:hypothetical protein